MTVEDLDAEVARYMRALEIRKDNESNTFGPHEELKTTPLFTWTVKQLVDEPSQRAPPPSLFADDSDSDDAVQRPEIFSQYALLGCEVETPPEVVSADYLAVTKPRAPSPILLNTNAPWSAFICGSQGSGKSYTLSCMLENCLIPAQRIGRMPSPLAGLLFHYDTHAGDGVCEAAYLGTHLDVNVLCSPSNFYNLQAKYENLEGTKGRVKVFPLLFKDKHLNTQRMMRLMAFSDKDGPVPLYMEVLIRILKEMAMERRGTMAFKYDEFRSRVNMEAFSKENQKGPLQLRLQLLESFMETAAMVKKLPPAKSDIFAARPGCLTIVDLTDPFVDPPSACVLFDICLALFLEDRSGVGKVVALDEAHKFMDQSSSSSVFTENLLTVIREQRHKGARVIIATQEPTISPKLLDLCSMTFVHRFTSPDWLNTLQRHLAGASATGGQNKMELQALFEKIVNLNTGESLLFSPSATLDVEFGKAQKLGMNHLKFRTRPRVTRDGGKSIMAANPSN